MKPDLDIVDNYEQAFGRLAAFKKASEFMIAYMALMRTPLPAAAQQAVEIARKFKDRAANQEELVTARLECWRFLQENSPSDNVNVPDVFGVKAAMRLLFSDPDNSDTIDIVGYFLKMANGFEDHSEEAELLLQQYFLGEPAP
jgi:hypothetical protein